MYEIGFNAFIVITVLILLAYFFSINKPKSTHTLLCMLCQESSRKKKFIADLEFSNQQNSY